MALPARSPNTLVNNCNSVQSKLKYRMSACNLFIIYLSAYQQAAGGDRYSVYPTVNILTQATREDSQTNQASAMIAALLQMTLSFAHVIAYHKEERKSQWCFLNLKFSPYFYDLINITFNKAIIKVK